MLPSTLTLNGGNQELNENYKKIETEEEIIPLKDKVHLMFAFSIKETVISLLLCFFFLLSLSFPFLLYRFHSFTYGHVDSEFVRFEYQDHCVRVKVKVK